MRIFLMFLAFSVLLLFPIRPIELDNSLTKTKAEIDCLERCLKNIGNELTQTKQALKDSLEKNEAERIDSQNRIIYLEREYNRVSEDKTLLEKDYKALQDSDNIPKILKTEFESYDKLATNQIRLWKIIAIGEAVIIIGGAIGVTIYLITR